ncbi:MAG: amidohydrolase [Planctomycetaceae bacterium]|nr:amidohydrolase [Planctomycetaceae bacterium]
MNPSIDRRQFFQQATAAAVAGILATGSNPVIETRISAAESRKAAVDAPASLPIVDTHQHLWDLTKFSLPWTKDEKSLAKSFVMSDYLAATKGLNVVKTVYMEVDVDPAQQVQEAEYVLELCGRSDNPMVGAVISGRPNSADFAAYIQRYKDNAFIKGVREVLHGDRTPPGFCLQPQFVKSVQLLGDQGKSFDLCLRSGELLDGDKLVAQCPKTRFIVDHCGNMSVQEADPQKRQVWMDGMKALAQRDNVVCKISGIIASARKDWKAANLAPNMRFSMDTFGSDRTMFAGDWPVCTLTATFSQWVGALKEIVRDMGMSPADQKKLFHDNAVTFYALRDKSTQ